MDPQACIALLHLSILNKRYPEAVQALDDYYQWRIKGGHEPTNCAVAGRASRDGDALATALATELADALEVLGVSHGHI